MPDESRMVTSSEKSLLRRMFLRSFLLQGSWNFERMQSLGFLYTILPALKEKYPDDGKRGEAIKRHTAYFNTQPCLASFVAGAAAKLEWEVARGKAGPEDVDNLKSGLMGPLGALGDSFFWAGVKPAAAVLSVAMFLAGLVWAPLVFVILYNIPHLVLRWTALRDGYEHGVKVAEVMARYGFQRKVHHLKAVSMATAGMIPAMAQMAPVGEVGLYAGLWPLVFLGMMLLYWSGARRGMPAVYMVAITAAIAAVYTFLPRGG